MARRQEINYSKLYRPPVKDRLSFEQLRELDIELNKYCVEKEDKRGKYSFIDITKWLIDRGGLSKHGEVIITCFSPAEYNSDGSCKKSNDCDSIIYEQLMADYDQWCKWKGRKEYGQKKQLQEYEKMEEQLVNKFTDF